jgi:hypothetical protein
MSLVRALTVAILSAVLPMSLVRRNVEVLVCLLFETVRGPLCLRTTRFLRPF